MLFIKIILIQGIARSSKFVPYTQLPQHGGLGLYRYLAAVMNCQQPLELLVPLEASRQAFSIVYFCIL